MRTLLMDIAIVAAWLLAAWLLWGTRRS